MSRIKSDDIQYHSDGYRSAHVAWNIKVGSDRVNFPLPLGRFSDDGGKTWKESYTDPRFNREWVEEHLTEDQRNGWWNDTAEWEREALVEFVHEVLGKHVKVWTEGRSGGWLVVDIDRDDMESNRRDNDGRFNSAPMTVKDYAKITRIVEATKKGFYEQYYSNIYANNFEDWLNEQKIKGTPAFPEYVSALEESDAK